MSIYFYMEPPGCSAITYTIYRRLKEKVGEEKWVNKIIAPGFQ